MVAGGRVAGNTDAQSDDLVLVWQSGDSPGRVEFVVTSTQVEMFVATLAKEGVYAAPDQRLVRGASADLLTTVAVAAGSPAAWAAVGLAVKKFFDRHKGKRIRVDETGLAEAENYSARDIEKIVRALSAAEPEDSDDRT
jgi:hypothetical protein